MCPSGESPGLNEGSAYENALQLGRQRHVTVAENETALNEGSAYVKALQQTAHRHEVQGGSSLDEGSAYADALQPGLCRPPGRSPPWGPQ